MNIYQSKVLLRIMHRSFFGAMMRESGKPDRIYNEAGYIDIHPQEDSVSYHYYIRDYLGSVRGVVDSNGTLEQATDYHSGGIPSSDYGDFTADDRLHTGKEFNNFAGLAWYDNSARMYDPITARFTTPDPLAEKYPDQSPYVHCANNPLKLTDPSGLEPTWKEAAAMSEWVYGANDDAAFGWFVSKKYFKEATSGGVYGVLFERTKDEGKKEYTFAFKGTNNFDDAINDIAQLFGTSDYYSQVAGIVKNITDFTGDNELTFTGHSLGGGLAATASYLTGNKAITFNAAALSESTIDNLNLQLNNGKIDAYISANDPIHLVQNIAQMKHNGNIKYTPVTSLLPLGAHSINGFNKTPILNVIKNKATEYMEMLSPLLNLPK